MNKKQLVEIMHKQSGLSRASTERTLNVILQSIVNAISNGEAVTLVGFGSFSVSHRAKRIGVDPRTGKKIDIEAKITPKFSAGNSLKSTINSK